ncbi:hypothetical protein D9M71_828460 [compost metagenome]
MTFVQYVINYQYGGMGEVQRIQGGVFGEFRMVVEHGQVISVAFDFDRIERHGGSAGQLRQVML